MKITAGLGSIDDYPAYAKAGADEVFIGYVPETWQQKYGPGYPLNRREVCFCNVQAGSRSELEILSGMTKEYGTSVSIAFNGLVFTGEQYPVIAGIMEDCLKLGFRSVIIADIGLLLYLDRTGLSRELDIHVSGEFGEMNHFIVSQLGDLGVSRIIFHRKVSAGNMAAIISEQKKEEPASGRKQPMAYEAFILNENCHFNGAYCNTVHCDEMPPMCRMPYRFGGKDIRRERTEADESETFSYDYGLAGLPVLEKAGIGWLKIVGRGADPDFMTECIRKVRNQIETLPSENVRQEEDIR